jgi:hypothetical protein
MPGAGGAGLGLGHLNHRHLQCALRHFRIGGRQIRPGDLQVKHRLPVGFVLGMQESEGLGFVFGVQAVLLARQGVLAVINARTLEQNESRFHN